MFINDQFIEQLNSFDLVNNAGERSPLLASNFIKINNLLNLLSSSQQQQQQQSQTLDNTNTTTSRKMLRIQSTESIANPTNNNDSEDPINSMTICCSQHRPTSPYIMYPIHQPMSPQPGQYLSTGSCSRRNSHTNLLKTPPILSRQSTVCYIHIHIKCIEEI
jgi:hypothetical protein